VEGLFLPIAHPMKGPMVTLTLQGFLESGLPFHWRCDRTSLAAFDVTFTPDFGGDPRAAKTLASREALEKFLSDLGVPKETQKRALGEADSRGSGSILGVLVSQTEIEGNWPQLRS
jgi:hypothetical protein